ncbi:unnamed protein product [Rotaria sordida]|uniref:Uncharacterized protein n=1 Tax=Rotaria sordida TaxID=392033 RepID=A0A819MXY8_9BILA|nr:unnamed protein product [Rotaria sordida]CAF1000032.1 unnamed protein product [Rotaria sordida]CAF1019457.1 unnamed protein product [Rotaria sordida]CAF1084052.1 unnamed protein product [Rotaria sordida]CAF1088866.1 unnamed protein product [Rotaria sordida]
MTIDHCQAWNETDLTENITEIIPPQPFVYYGRYHQRRSRREYLYKNSTSDLNTIETVLSILPLDRLGAIIGQIMATSLKEIFNPNVGKKIINVLENQVPSLLTSLFSNLFSTFRIPARASTSNITVSINISTNKPLSNSSTPSLINFMRRPRTK